MRKAYLIVLLFLIGFLTAGCKSYRYGAGEENVRNSNLTYGVVKSKIIKGKTTQEEILKIFASNMVTKNKSNK